jgi:glycosyltransferase involved in cell wall biosynthesis
VIEQAAPFLARRLGAAELVLACGEPAGEPWSTCFVQRLAPVPVRFFLEPAFRYCSEQGASPATIREQIQIALNRLLEGAAFENCVVWAHNLGIGRNMILSRAVVRACAARTVPLLMHHHDWWFENRWQRWPEMRAGGFRTLKDLARTVFATGPQVRHVAINRADARLLQRHFGERAAWLPNLTQPFPEISRGRLQATRVWLRNVIPSRHAPLWIVPARVLRRKNIAEALLLTRWLRPQAWLVTTAGASSADETAYAGALKVAAQTHRWPICLGVLSQAGPDAPSVAELLASSEVVLLTSLQEGFGLPYLEAAAAGRPLMARAVPNVAPDLEQFGFALPYLYREVMIHPDLFDWPGERARQQQLFGAWRAQLPQPCRALAGVPRVLRIGRKPRPVPFSRLTLTAQLEVLAQPVQRSWDLCAPLNPHLPEWRARAQADNLERAAWPKAAERWLSGEAYARQFQRLLKSESRTKPNSEPSLRLQTEFIGRKLKSECLFPLLWATET